MSALFTAGRVTSIHTGSDLNFGIVSELDAARLTVTTERHAA